ncbi:hypothetical protein [Brucella intermedia]|uniref:hypothetical protein n=1 Tax=Brucella intermedia TaxID=94625 RepID=UPI00235F0F87|nr:hypothetical protein [Brucella intermedia]
MTIHTLSLAVPAMQQQAIRAFAQMKTLAQVDQVFELVSKLTSLSEELDPVSAALYETTLERRAELLRAKEEKTPPPRSYFPVRPKSTKSRSEAATGKRDPERWARKRRLGDMAALPPHMRDQFTEGERSVLYIVAADVRRYGSCRCTNKEIGDRAGVKLTTTRNALRKARQYGLINIQHREQWRGKNLANIVTLVCKRWLAWLAKFRPNLGFHYQGCSQDNFKNKGVKKPTSSETYSKIKQNGQPILYSKRGPMGGFQPFASRKPSLE